MTYMMTIPIAPYQKKRLRKKRLHLKNKKMANNVDPEEMLMNVIHLIRSGIVLIVETEQVCLLRPKCCGET